MATGAPVGHGHNIITGRYACYGTYRAADGGWLAVGAIEPKFFANLCRLLGCEQWCDTSWTTTCRTRSGRTSAAAFATRDRDAWVADLAGADTCVTPVLSVEELVDDEQFPPAAPSSTPSVRRPRTDRMRPTGSARSVRCWRGWSHRSGPIEVGDPSRSDTERLLGGAGMTSERIAETAAARGRGMSAIGVDDIDGLIGVEQYEEEGEFPVEQGYVWTTCASVENGNPLFWDAEVADEVTGGPIAPPTMVSVWFRPHHWAPGRTGQACPSRSTST